MKIKIVYLICCFCISAIASAQDQEPSSVLNSWDQDPGMIYLTGRGTADGRMFEYKIEPAALKDTPAWIPGKTDPPLSVPKAIAIAKQTALADYTRFQEFQPAQIELMPIGSRTAQNQWFYVISLYPVVEKLIVYDSDITVVILMNGFVVKPKLREKKVPKSGDSWISPASDADLQEPEGQPAIQATEGKFILVRRGEKDNCAIRMSGGGDPNRAEYDAYYQPDGSGNFTASTVVATHGSVHEGGDESDLYIRCGPFRIQWSGRKLALLAGLQGLG